MTERELLARTAALAADYLETLDTRQIRPERGYREMHELFDRAVPDRPADPADVVEELAAVGEQGVMAIGSGRWYGFVAGGAVPSSLAADWLVSAWDQNTGLAEPTPATSALEAVTGRWVLELLGLPPDSSFAFVTGCQMAHVTCLAAARHSVYRRAGWDLPQRGLAGAPPLRVVLGGKRHVTIKRALRLLGIGESQEVVLPADSEGRMATEQLGAALDGSTPTIVCAQAGEVNTGAFDSLPEIADACEATGAWLHVDGAFGIWAAVSPRLRHLVAGLERADSWTTDAHKWLNVPYDSGIVLCRHPASHRAAMTTAAAYLIQDAGAQRVRDEVDWVPEFSRRARGFSVYAALRSLGRNGLVELVERCCDGAARFGQRIVQLEGVELLNEVVLNQVLFRFESDERTDEVLARVQESGRIWLSGTTWDGLKAIRVSVSNWQTGDEEIDLAVEAFREAYAGKLPAR